MAITFLHRLRRERHRFKNVLIPGTAAGISRNCLSKIFLCRLFGSLEMLRSGKHQARRTVSALQAISFTKGLLDRMQIAVALQSLDRRDLCAIGLKGKHRARLYRVAIQQEGTCTAVASVTTYVSAGKV